MMVSGVFKGIWRKTRSIRECTRRKLSNIGPLGILWSYKKTIANGKKVYVRLMKRYGANTRIYIEHYPGTGDVYITCALLENYHKMYGLGENYIVTLVGNSSKKIASLLNIRDTEVLTQQESDDMIRYLCFMGGHIKNTTILHYGPGVLYTRILDDLASYNGLDFMTMYMNTVFKDMDWTRDSIRFVEAPNADELAREYLDTQNLRLGHTAVLFPYANTIEHLPMEFWEEFARHLREIGFSVCTNVEPGGVAIPGTTPVFVPYSVLANFVELAGTVVGLRSGVFDILAHANCRKYILYPTPNYFKFGVGSIMDYFSLIDMGIGEKIDEYEFERIYVKECFKCVFFDICNNSGVTVPNGIYDRNGDYSHPELFVFHKYSTKEIATDGSR